MILSRYLRYWYLAISDASKTATHVEPRDPTLLGQDLRVQCHLGNNGALF